MPHALIIERPLTVGRTDHYSYPAGRYVAKFTDRDGTYYASPIWIERRFLLPLTEARTGGFYAPFRNPFHLEPYDVDSEENIGFHGLGFNTITRTKLPKKNGSFKGLRLCLIMKRSSPWNSSVRGRFGFLNIAFF